MQKVRRNNRSKSTSATSTLSFLVHPFSFSVCVCGLPLTLGCFGITFTLLVFDVQFGVENKKMLIKMEKLLLFWVAFFVSGRRYGIFLHKHTMPKSVTHMLPEFVLRLLCTYFCTCVCVREREGSGRLHTHDDCGDDQPDGWICEQSMDFLCFLFFYNVLNMFRSKVAV